MTPEENTDRQPLIAYSVLHQPGPGAARRGYEETVEALHTALLEESRAIDAARRRALGEMTAQAAQRLRASLSDFLSMPIQSDSAEVARIFREALDGVTFRSGPFGVISSSEGTLIAAPPGIAQKPKILNGKRHLAALGFAVAGKSPPVYESVYLLRGGSNLDVMEEIIRDRLGVYRSPHGEHIVSRPRTAIGLYNHVGSTGSRETSGYGEAVLWFSKPAMQYEPFRAALSAIAGELQSRQFVLGTDIWQRKLGLGPGREFILRCVLSDGGAFRKFLATIASIKGDNTVLDEIRLRGVCVLKRPVRQDEQESPA
jgi:hypothetical protein